MKRAINFAESIEEGFVTKKRNTSEPCSLINSSGKLAVFALLEMAKEIIDECFPKHFKAEKLVNTINCQGTLSEGIDLNVYSMERGLCENFETRSDWPPTSDMGVGETKSPDVLTYVREKKDTEMSKQFVIIGEVKSSVELVGSANQEIVLFQQAWRQALLGLVNSNHTYGILLHPLKCELFELKIETRTRDGSSQLYATTLKETFEFLDTFPKIPIFNTVSIISLLKKIIAIILELPLYSFPDH